MGSGTVLALARSQGHRAAGIDLDPLAVLISKVWTTSIDPAETREAAAKVLYRARDYFRVLAEGSAYPANSDDETRAFVRYWFDGYARRQLTSLAKAIRQLRDPAIKNALWCAFSRLIVAKQAGASLAMDLAHSRPHKVFKVAPTKPFNRFIRAVDQVLEGCIDVRAPKRGPAVDVRWGDARDLPFKLGSFDLVLTSPPYLNAIDYFRCSKFPLVWMGYRAKQMRALRSQSVGTEVGGDANAAASAELAKAMVADLGLQPQLPKRQEAILRRYISDMWGSMSEVARVLAPGGKAVYVIGENTIRSTYVPTADILLALGGNVGLTVVKQQARALPANCRYLPPPAEQTSRERLGNRIRREVVLTFTNAPTDAHLIAAHRSLGAGRA